MLFFCFNIIIAVVVAIIFKMGVSVAWFGRAGGGGPDGYQGCLSFIVRDVQGSCIRKGFTCSCGLEEASMPWQPCGGRDQKTVILTCWQCSIFTLASVKG